MLCVNQDGGICHHGAADTDLCLLSVLYGDSVGSSSSTHCFNDSDSSRVFIFRAMWALRFFWLLLFLLSCPAAEAVLQGELGKVARSRAEAAKLIRGCSQGPRDDTAVLGWCTSSAYFGYQ